MGKRNHPGKSPWDSIEGWKHVEVGDEVLVGSEEFGFMGLEVLDPAELKDSSMLLECPSNHTANDEESQNKTMDLGKKRKVKTKQVPRNVSGASTEDLLRTIAKLEEENKRLKKEKRSMKKPRILPEDENRDDGDDEKRYTDVVERVDVSAWKDFFLDDRILDSLSLLGFSAPTHIQAECLPAAIRDKRDVIGAAQTVCCIVQGTGEISGLGSGKTLAFGLPVLHSLIDDNNAKSEEKKLKCLIMVPTRELGMQVYKHLDPIARDIGVRVVPIVGGISHQKQDRLLTKHPPEIVVATPGRLWELIRDSHAHVSDMSGLRFLILDEADRMVQQGHYEELKSIFSLVRNSRLLGGNESSKSYKRGLQTMVFSATLTLPTTMKTRLRKGGGGSSGSASLESLMDAVPFSDKPKIVDVTSSRKLADKVTESYISCPEKDRDAYLYCILAAHPGRTLIFVNAISSVRRLAAVLKLLGLPVRALHAGMQQRARLKSIDKFSSDSSAILVATDVAARGLDIKDVKCVIHYQIPASADTYVHRSGRTARAEEDGVSIAFVTPQEDARFKALLRSLSSCDPPAFPIDMSLMSECRRRVLLATQYDSITRKESKEKSDRSWRKQHAEELGIILSDESEDELEGKKLSLNKPAREKSSQMILHEEQKRADEIKRELDDLLSEPLQPKFSKKFFAGGAAAGVALQKKHQSHDQSQSLIATSVKAAQNLAFERKKTREKGGKARKSKPKTRDEALNFAVNKYLQKKQLKKSGGKRGIVVAHGAFGRNTHGATALDALKQHQNI